MTFIPPFFNSRISANHAKVKELLANDEILIKILIKMTNKLF